MRGLVAAELIKIRSVRSTPAMVGLTVALSAGLATLICTSFRTAFADPAEAQQRSFDPLFATFYSLTLGQLPLVVLAAFVVTSEYATGTLGASLAATPQRLRWYAAKVSTGALLAAGLAVVTVAATFAAAQAALGPFRPTLAAPEVRTAVVGACLYLVLIYLFATGLATLLRGAIPTLGILLPLLFLGSQGLGNVPVLKNVTQFLPDQAGLVIMHIAGIGDQPNFTRPYGPWAGIAIMALWTVAALAAGGFALRRRDV